MSEDWRRVSEWGGEGSPPPELGAELAELAATATAQGRRLRLWGTPDRPAVWELLRESGVDLINTDDLAGLRAFLTAAERMTDGS